MRICLVYDCLFPYTVGGAERWYRDLGTRLVREGHEVTYLTLRQWERQERPDVGGMEVVAVGPRFDLYTGGRRRMLPPVAFGAGVLAHLARHGRRYDVVHTASFPYFSLLATAAARRLHGFGLVVDWLEVWSREYWNEYLGRAGVLGAAVQRACARVRQRAFCFSELHTRRLRALGLREEPTVLRGLFAGPLERPDPAPAQQAVVFAGRHIPEKRVPSLVEAIAVARDRVPGLRCEIFGDGPERARVENLVAERRLEDAVTVHGFVPAAEVERALRSSLCMVLPSLREGYGQIVVEAAAIGVPSVVCAAPDNAAVELIEEGRNGFVARSGSPEQLAEAIVRVHAAGHDLREATADWFADNARRLSLDASLDVVAEAYGARV